MNRRDFLRLAGLASAGLVVAACGPVYDQLADTSTAGQPLPTHGLPALSRSAYLGLNRATFGPTLLERVRVAEIGLAAFIEEQLAYESINDDAINWRLKKFETLNLKANELFEYGNKLFDDLDTTVTIKELRQATITRQVYSQRQLYEVMVEFWSDHFNISVDKSDCWFLKTVDDREVIRKHAMGNFRDLVQASAHSPAMLMYLDNQSNDKSHPNENYARELMELHTLSVDGGYTQQDVMELARCLTGWTVKENFWRGEFEFNAEMHDDGTKTVLGNTITPNGQAEAEGLIDSLALHPATARFIATKLARRFIADEPPAELIDKAIAAFLNTRGDIKSVLGVILLNGLPLAQPKYKRPQNFIASALRQLNASVDTGGRAGQPTYPLLDFVGRMGQLPFGWPTPDGYPDVAPRWLGNLMPRWQFALALARNEIDGVHLETLPTDADDLATLLTGAPLEPTARDQLLSNLRTAGADDETLPQILTAGLIASPTFQWR
jgi:uncharacterized protein (DUF1800 family)